MNSNDTSLQDLIISFFESEHVYRIKESKMVFPQPTGPDNNIPLQRLMLISLATTDHKLVRPVIP